jgi:hypothetical protein
MGEEWNAYSVAVGKPEGRRPLGRCRHGWEDSIKMGHSEIGWRSVVWINLAHDGD